MTQSPPPYVSPSEVGVRPPAALQATFLTQAFTWMFAGLLLTAAVSYLVSSSPSLIETVSNYIFLVFIAQLALVVIISGAINRIGATAALGLFFVYAASLGLTVGVIVSYYTTGSVVTAFLASAAMFGGAAIYGATTKRSLASLGGILFMGLIGLIVASVLNIFLRSNEVSWIISIVGVVLFTALTAYDVQRISAGDLAARLGSMEKAAVVGALQLYLDFINLFLFFLRLFGSQR
jgi:FtsH-binding integral membrane protein